MKFVYSLINMLAEMAPYLLFGFLVAGVLYAFCRESFTVTIFRVQAYGR